MDLNLLDKKLKKIHIELTEESNKLEEIIKKLSEKESEKESETEIDPIKRNETYSSFLSEKEKIYQKQNNAYKKLISEFSLPYLELCEWYIGPELPRSETPTFFDSKDDINQLYFLFIMGLFLRN